MYAARVRRKIKAMGAVLNQLPEQDISKTSDALAAASNKKAAKRQLKKYLI